MSGGDRLVRLAALGRLLQDRELDRLRGLLERRARIEAEAATLRGQRPAVDPASPAAAAGALDRWQNWRRARLEALAGEAAQAAAEAEAQRAAAVRAFGRARALDRIADSD